MERHDTMRVQFFMNGPFDNIETLSVSFLDGLGEVTDMIVEPGPFPQYQLWSKLTELAARHERMFGHQQSLF